MSDARPLGFFDSGLGGLTVLRAVRRQFPFENFVYLGDTARLPYGTKSPETIFRYTVQNIRVLKSHNVKAIVIACNSASTSLLSFKGQASATSSERSPRYDEHRELLSSLPIYNVIEPGAEAALAVSSSKRIGVLGTRATIQSGAYVDAIQSRDSSAIVFQAAAPLLVPLVEEGWESDPLTNLIVYRYLGPLLSNQIDTLILGCTHYPALTESIRRVTGLSTNLVDSSLAIAKLLDSDFKSGSLAPKSAESSGRLDLYATDTSPAMAATAKRLMSDPEILDFKPYDIV
jgi:glutamate racemase